MAMNAKVYEEKRNDLLKLIEDVAKKCVDLDEKTKKELDAVAEKLKRNSFEIVLAGEFQGGKSTTFDTICGGREISPRGFGIKTSATKISAISLPEDEKEYVDIFWKTDHELLLTMMGVLGRYLNKQHPCYKYFYATDDKEEKLNAKLTDPEVIKFANQCIKEEWELYRKNPRLYDTENSGKLDLLQISTLILKFFKDKELEGYRKQSRVTVDTLRSMVVFPVDWATRWEKMQDTEFKLSEILFVFLSNAFCHIHSKNLERLGCIITDCPGLFAGPWDTAVANSAMERADAILYLIGGQKAITDGDLRALGKIVENQQEHKLFFAINARQSKEHTKEHFRPTDCACINSRGFELDKDDIFIFNARLAFNAKSFPYVADETKWKKEVGADFLAKGKEEVEAAFAEWKKAVEAKWRKEVGADLANFLDLDATDPDDQEQIQKYRSDLDSMAEVSGLTELVDKIEYTIINKKAESILVQGGSQKAFDALNKLSVKLKVVEDGAKKSLDDCKKEAEAARAKLNKFQEDAKLIVDNNLSDEASGDQLADNFITQVFVNNSEFMADEIVAGLTSFFRRSSSITTFVSLLKSKIAGMAASAANTNMQPDFIAQIEAIIQDAITSVSVPATSGWWANVQNGDNNAFNVTYGKTLKLIQEQMHNKWRTDCNDADTLLAGLNPIVDDDWQLSVEGAGIDLGGGVISAKSEMFQIMIKRIVTTITTGVAAAIAAVLLVFLFAEVVVIPSIAIAWLVSNNVNKINQWIEENIIYNTKFKDSLKTRITADLKAAWENDKDRLKKIVWDCVIESPKRDFGIVPSLKCRCYQSFHAQAEVLEERVKSAELLKAEALGEQERIAEESKQIRKEQIDPASDQIAKFNKDLMPYFKK